MLASVCPRAMESSMCMETSLYGYTSLRSKSPENPSHLHTTSASLLPQSTVFHCPSWHTSTRPSNLFRPFTRQLSPSMLHADVHFFIDNYYYNQEHMSRGGSYTCSCYNIIIRKDSGNFSHSDIMDVSPFEYSVSSSRTVTTAINQDFSFIIWDSCTCRLWP